MKKLMFGAAIAATGMTFAAAPAGQVYDVQLSIKSTAAAKATINNKTNPFLGEDKETVIYRKQASYTWKGLIWGCSCETIDGVWEEVNEIAETGYSTIKGCILWDTKSKAPVYIGNGADINDPASAQYTGFQWDFINAIDKTGKNCEGSWVMNQYGKLCEEDAQVFAFRGAGFGTLNVVGTEEEDCGGNYLKSISGSFAGWMIAPDETAVVNPTGCTFCGYDPGSSECVPSAAWNYCACVDIADDTRTAAYGTWSVKYNSSLSKKLSNPVKISNKGVQNFIVSIRDAYNFNSLPLVAARIAAIENTFWQLDPTGCDELEAAVASARKNVEAAEDRVEAVSYESLKKVQIEAAAALVRAEGAYSVASNEYDLASEAYTIANGEYKTAVYNQTNVNAQIIYKNGSGDETTNTVVGCAAITANINKFEGYTLVVMRTSIPGLLGIEESKTWAECKALVAEYEKATVDTKAALTTAEQNKTTKAQAKSTALTNLVKAQDAKNSADADLANITSLQYEAQRALDKAEAAYTVAEKAYEDAGCND